MLLTQTSILATNQRDFSVTRHILYTVTSEISPQGKPKRHLLASTAKAFTKITKRTKEKEFSIPELIRTRGGGVPVAQTWTSSMAPSNARVSVWCKLSRRGNSRKHRKRYGERSNWSHERYPPAWVELLLARSGAGHPGNWGPGQGFRWSFSALIRPKHRSRLRV
ncbi:hypothetical protein CFIO01_01045 [Colletotrichum fioriniae PJ7]|uniref:Uncharacterized protein n=1 Tax=Colletotrichum fioriniae PJ7 TaxID=1445577 RepID=A0A010S9J1_9PEZI|nr:hypothetical protein CFIO01_01045 [Colletotrichum fioriniae PJ7]